ncbi:DUF808 domain-containing protein [Persephonella sp.]
MASGLLALFDDIAVIMDDVAAATKMATKKTSAVLADDLAVNAQKASGFASERELPIIWAIAKGSFVNKLIILPSIFLLSYFAPYLITPILLIGGVYLSYEGAEKVVEFLFYRNKSRKENRKEMSEKEKIRSAIITDFILSLEIIVIALSTVRDKPFEVQVATVTVIALIATVGVYGLVAFIVRMDDMGLALIARYRGFLQKLGLFMVLSLPYIIKGLSVIGTIAMLAVGGGIFAHNVEYIHHLAEKLPPFIGEIGIGLVIGLLALALLKPVKMVFRSNGQE